MPYLCNPNTLFNIFCTPDLYKHLNNFLVAEVVEVPEWTLWTAESLPLTRPAAGTPLSPHFSRPAVPDACDSWDRHFDTSSGPCPRNCRMDTFSCCCCCCSGLLLRLCTRPHRRCLDRHTSARLLTGLLPAAPRPVRSRTYRRPPARSYADHIPARRLLASAARPASPCAEILPPAKCGACCHRTPLVRLCFLTRLTLHLFCTMDRYPH
jgi:hypothetical protein